MIKPTIGRVVWFYNHAFQVRPMAALVAFVHSDRMVNLAVADSNGNMSGVTSVPLIQPGDEKPDGVFCTWMPYQIGQAAKTEELEEKLRTEGGK